MGAAFARARNFVRVAEGRRPATDATTGKLSYGREAVTWWDAILLVVVGVIGLYLILRIWMFGATATYTVFSEWGASKWADADWQWTLYAIPVFVSGFQWIYLPPVFQLTQLIPVKSSIMGFFIFFDATSASS